MNLIDTHFHIDCYRNYRELAEYISEKKQYTICVTNSPGIFLSCKKQISETKYLKFALGFHPMEETLTKNDLEDFFYLFDRTNYIGEVGLDFSNNSRMKHHDQLAFFNAIAERCAKENKMMTVHTRRAEEQAIEIIGKHKPKKCIIHWFTGTETQINKLVELGCYFSINANMTISKNRAKYLKIPKDKILIESDGPYTKVLGTTYSPEKLPQAYEQIAKPYGIQNLSEIVFENFKRILTQ